MISRRLPWLFSLYNRDISSGLSHWCNALTLGHFLSKHCKACELL